MQSFYRPPRRRALLRNVLKIVEALSSPAQLLINVCLLAATLGLAFYAAKQWRDTNATLREITKQTPAIINSAEAAKKSADVAVAAEHTAERQLLLSDRPQLSVEKIDAPSLYLNSGFRNGMTISMRVRISGHLFAHTVLSYGSFTFYDQGPLDLQRRMKKACLNGSPYRRQTGQVVAPDEEKTIYGVSTYDTADLDRRLLDEKHTSPYKLFGYLLGCVTYRSELGPKIFHTGFAWLIIGNPSDATVNALKANADLNPNEHPILMHFDGTEPINFTPNINDGYED